MSTPAYYLASYSDGTVVHLELQTSMRAPRVPERGGWQGPDPLGYFYRDATVANATDDLERYAELRAPAVLVSVRELTFGERILFARDRNYRDALTVDVAGVLKHDMAKARACHRAILRHQAGEKLLLIERDHVQATIDKDPPKVKTLEDEHTRLIRLPDDPRIDTAASVDELKLITL